MLDFARLTVERETLDRLEYWLHDADIWSVLLSAQSSTCENRCLGFIGLAAARGFITETFVQEANSFPNKAYLAVPLC